MSLPSARRVLAIAVAALLNGLTAARATPLDFNFTVHATTGSLAGTSSSGNFSFDSSVIPAGGGIVINTGLLTSLAFTWDSISYTAATANTGDLHFDATGALIQATFGNDCSPICQITFGQDSWAVEWYPQINLFDFFYSTPNDSRLGVQTGTIAISPVPEPGTLGLVGMGLIVIGLMRRRLKAY